MNFPGFYAVSSAWLFLLAIPLIIFYFLKLKRPQMEIPSLALWRQVINDQRVNSPFQKFKRNLLLLLQLLLLSLLIIAAMQPFLAADAQRAEYLPVLIDCSASMGAIEEPGGQSRLSIAKEQVAELIDNLLPDQRLSLITVDSTARRLTDFTNNTRILHDALKKIREVDVPSDFADGLRMTQALSRTVPIDRIVIYSDGNFPPRIDFELPFEVNYQQLPPAGTNMGITQFNARRSGTSSWDVFVRIRGDRQEQTTATVELFQDGQSVGEDNVVLEPEESQRMAFPIETSAPSQLEVRLNPDGFDSLASDNRAYLDLPAARPLTVYCPTELASFRHALRGLDGLVVYPQDDDSTSPADYDLLITDRGEDAGLEAAVKVFVGVIPEDVRTLLSVQTGLAEIVDWQRSAPLLQHVQLAELQIADEPLSADGVTDSDYEELGYQILAHGRSGPLALEKRTGTDLAYYLLFHTDRSTLPYRVGFPILVHNTVQVALQQASLSEVRGQPTRVLSPQSLQPDQQYQVTGPNGETHSIKSNAEGIVRGVSAPYVGHYIFREGRQEVARIGASLLNSQESSLTSVEEIQFRELSVAASEATIKNDRPLWPAFSIVAFCVLLVEWWYYQRRPAGMPT